MDDILKKLGKDQFDGKKIDDIYRERRVPNSPSKFRGIVDHLPEKPQKIIVPERNTIRCFVVCGQTVFMALDDILPECGFLTEGTRTLRMSCIADEKYCDKISYNCTGKLLHRLGKIAKVQENWKLYILYWRLYLTMDKDKDRRAALVIWADTSDMAIIIVNEHQLNYYLNRGDEVSEEYQIEMGLYS